MTESALKVHFSSSNNNWATPQDFFDKLNEEFHFELDVCATAENAKCKKYYSPEEDGLKQEILSPRKRRILVLLPAHIYLRMLFWIMIERGRSRFSDQ